MAAEPELLVAKKKATAPASHPRPDCGSPRKPERVEVTYVPPAEERPEDRQALVDYLANMLAGKAA